MKRSDRLYALIDLLKDGRLRRAEDMADRLGVSVRTIYRDMETLAASGVPVEGARGIGFTAQATTTLPPLNLTDEELEALHLGLAIVGQSQDAIGNAAETLFAKIDAVLPQDRARAPNQFGLAVYPFADAARGFQHMPAFRSAVRARQRLRVTLPDGPHHIRPLKLDYCGRIWTCVAWDENTDNFTTFRIDQINDIATLPGLFVDEPGKTLADFDALPRD